MKAQTEKKVKLFKLRKETNKYERNTFRCSTSEFKDDCSQRIFKYLTNSKNCALIVAPVVQKAVFKFSTLLP